MTSDIIASFYRDNTRGWHWYEPVETNTEQEDEGDETNKEKPTKTPSFIVAEYRKKLENTLAKAWLHPTPANIRAYQALQKTCWIVPSSSRRCGCNRGLLQTPHIHLDILR